MIAYSEGAVAQRFLHAFINTFLAVVSTLIHLPVQQCTRWMKARVAATHQNFKIVELGWKFT